MSDPHAGHGHDAGHGKKKGSVWGGVGMVVSIGIGLVVLFTLGGSIFGMAIDSLNSAMQTIGNSLTNTGNSIGSFSTVVRSISSGVSRLLFSIVSALIPIVIYVLIAKLIMDAVKKSKGGGGGDHGHH